MSYSKWNHQNHASCWFFMFLKMPSENMNILANSHELETTANTD